MCIRDRYKVKPGNGELIVQPGKKYRLIIKRADGQPDITACLLYTSDAADERSSVDLGGRRIIKKKTKEDNKSARIL